MDEPFERITLSFYKYVIFDEVELFRDQLYAEWEQLNIFGRTYLANEGINAQISVPKQNLEKFKETLYNHEEFTDVPLKIAVDDDGKSFYKLMIKVRDKIHYEYEVGHFQGAINLDVDTFREALPKAVEELEDSKEKKILLYCTGGIRCEKASAYLKHNGFEDVNQLYGGIIEYAHLVKEDDVPSKFIGKNFVFDDRLGERITEDVISHCHQCGEVCDTHVNCANDACHILFIQCESCAVKMDSCCTTSCQDFLKLPIEEQKAQRAGNPAKGTHRAYTKGRVRPKLIDINKKAE